MRFLVLSDIHANLTALEAALAAAKGRWEHPVCLGDVVDYGPDPNETTDAITVHNDPSLAPDEYRLETRGRTLHLLGGTGVAAVAARVLRVEGGGEQRRPVRIQIRLLRLGLQEGQSR